MHLRVQQNAGSVSNLQATVSLPRRILLLVMCIHCDAQAWGRNSRIFVLIADHERDDEFVETSPLNFTNVALRWKAQINNDDSQPLKGIKFAWTLDTSPRHRLIYSYFPEWNQRQIILVWFRLCVRLRAHTLCIMAMGIKENLSWCASLVRSELGHAWNNGSGPWEVRLFHGPASLNWDDLVILMSRTASSV
jgi:hypothetical protein